uniref:Exo-alpha-sialidase n=1 Tax=candidate division WOR-3 bacterium TaxID=2052148 RepID=A0A7C4GI22_UNCW3
MKPRKFVVLIFAAGLAATAAAWTPPERVDRRPDGYDAFLPSLAVSQHGTPHVVWLECAGGTNLFKIMYARRSGDTWTIPANVSRDSSDLRRADIVVDTAGVPLVAWSEQYLQRISYARPAGDTWTSPKPATTRRGVYPRLFANSGGRIHMMFGELGGSDALWYTRYDPGGDSWLAPILAADDSGELDGQDIVAGAGGRLHAVWMNFRTYGVDYSSFDGDSWSTPEHVPDPAPSGQSCDPRIACDSQGRPHVVWEERWGGYKTYYTARVGDTWTTPVRVTDLNCRLPEVCVDDRNSVHVVWSWDYGTRHAVRTDTGWTEPDTVNNRFSFTSFVGSGSRLHLAYSESPRGVFYTETSATGLLGGGGVSGAMATAGSTLADRVVVVAFTLPKTGRVALELVDVAGRQRVERDLGILPAGNHRVRVGVDSLPVGVYACVVRSFSSEVVGRVVKVR